MILVATPLVLLRSEESVALGAKLFESYIVKRETTESTSPSRAKISLAVLWGLSVAIFIQLALQNVTNLSAKFFYSILLGWIAITLIVAFTSAIAESASSGLSPTIGASATVSLAFSFPIVCLLLSDTWADALVSILGFSAISLMVILSTKYLMSRPNATYVFAAQIFISPYGGYLLGIIVRAVLIRAYSTLRHPLRGMAALPGNWSRNAYVSDAFEPPELVPDSKTLAFPELLNKFKHKLANGYEPQRVLGGVLTFFVMFFPAIVWRCSIKSTAWFYFPLLFVAKRGLGMDDKTRVILAKAYTRKIMNIVGLISAAFFLVSGLMAAFRPDWLAEIVIKTRVEGAPLPPIAYVLVLDWRLIWSQPWQIAYLISAAISVYLFYRYDEIGKNIQSGMPEDRHYAELRLLQRLGNLSLLLTLLGLIWAILAFSDAMW